MNKKTVFVVGAGASKEARLPTGEELKKEISNLLDIRSNTVKLVGNHTIIEALRLHAAKHGLVTKIDSLLADARHIRDAMPQAISIDNFIDSHRENVNIAACGKLAIAKAILDYERKSILYFDQHDINHKLDFSKLSTTWYTPFFRLITENCATTKLVDRLKSVAIIVFNYDRCIEHFLFYALQNYYRIDDRKAAQILENLSIYHPYGSVGLLPWQGNSGVMNFGVEPTGKQLLELTDKIKTFAEGTDPGSSYIIEIRNNMQAAHKLVFLGFAFHKLNMDLIKPANEINFIPNCYGTTLGISDGDKTIVERNIKKLYRSEIKIQLANMKCFDFFNDFRFRLSF